MTGARLVADLLLRRTCCSYESAGLGLASSTQALMLSWAALILETSKRGRRAGWDGVAGGATEHEDVGDAMKVIFELRATFGVGVCWRRWGNVGQCCPLYVPGRGCWPHLHSANGIFG